MFLLERQHVDNLGSIHFEKSLHDTSANFLVQSLILVIFNRNRLLTSKNPQQKKKNCHQIYKFTNLQIYKFTNLTIFWGFFWNFGGQQSISVKNYEHHWLYKKICWCVMERFFKMDPAKIVNMLSPAKTPKKE